MKFRALLGSSLALGLLVTSGGVYAAEEAPDAVIPNPSMTAHTLDQADLSAWLDGFVPYAITAGDIAGGVVTVVKDGEGIFAKGYGYSDIAAHTPGDPERTLF